MKISTKLIVILLLCIFKCSAQEKKAPNIIFVIVDQWRAESTGYNGNTDVITPNIDKIAKQSINLKNAVSGMSVCTPFRAQLMSGMYPTTSGVFLNDVMLDTALTTIGKVYKNNGYDTGFIGKWHIDGHGRERYIPEERHQGFDYWKTLECTHEYNKSYYYEGNSPIKKTWDGYDALAQTKDAADYIKNHSKQDKPFLLFVSLGPPHDPYQSAPEKYKNLYKNKSISINPNVPDNIKKRIEADLRGYYSHMSAIDDGIGEIWNAIEESGTPENTIFVFTADHGDLMGAHGQRNKQQPYNESIKVPFLISYPKLFGSNAQTSNVLLNSPDIMPTLLKLSGLPVPKTVEGKDLSKILSNQKKDNIKASLISCVSPFGQWGRAIGGKEYRGIYTKNYTYVNDLKGPWLLFDNEKDPYQQNNLVGNSSYVNLQKSLDKQLQKILKHNHDEFKPGAYYIKKWNYFVDNNDTVPFNKFYYDGSKPGN